MVPLRPGTEPTCPAVASVATERTAFFSNRAAAEATIAAVSADPARAAVAAGGTGR